MIRSFKIFSPLSLLFLLPLFANAQTEEWKLLHQGNKHFYAKRYQEAEKLYREAKQKHPNSARTYYNLADAYLSSGNNAEAMKHFAEAAKREDNKMLKALSFHNMGYVCQVNKEYDKAIDYYKEALRNNPDDADTRYNLAVCQKMRKNGEQQKQNQQSQENEKQQSDEKQKQSDNEEKEQKPSETDGISKDNAEQLLNVAKRAEKETRKKLEQAQPRQHSRGRKNW